MKECAITNAAKQKEIKNEIKEKKNGPYLCERVRKGRQKVQKGDEKNGNWRNMKLLCAKLTN